MTGTRGSVKRRLLSIASLAVITVIVALTAPPAAAVEPPKFNPPKSYYLALGDSISYGYQASKRLAGLPPSGFNTGYVDVFAARLRTIQPSITVVNYSCVGESTRTFIAGPCPGNQVGLGLHDEWTGTQLEAALGFLSAHKGEVSPITVTLWGNDARELSEACEGDLDCIFQRAPAAIAQAATNLKLIFERLRAATPQAEIIFTGPWNISIGGFRESDPLFMLYDEALSQVAADSRVRFVDLFPVFNPQGDIGAETAAICSLTLLCSEGDIHPSDEGFRVIGDQVWRVSGYDRLLD